MEVRDRYGYEWVVVRDPDVDDLVNAMRLVNATLTHRNFGPQVFAPVYAFTGEQGGNRSTWPTCTSAAASP